MCPHAHITEPNSLSVRGSRARLRALDCINALSCYLSLTLSILILKNKKLCAPPPPGSATVIYAAPVGPLEKVHFRDMRAPLSLLYNVSIFSRSSHALLTDFPMFLLLSGTFSPSGGSVNVHLGCNHVRLIHVITFRKSRDDIDGNVSLSFLVSQKKKEGERERELWLGIIGFNTTPVSLGGQSQDLFAGFGCIIFIGRKGVIYIFIVFAELILTAFCQNISIRGEMVHSLVHNLNKMQSKIDNA